MTFRRAALILACLLAWPALAQAPREPGAAARPATAARPAPPRPPRAATPPARPRTGAATAPRRAAAPAGAARKGAAARPARPPAREGAREATRKRPGAPERGSAAAPSREAGGEPARAAVPAVAAAVAGVPTARQGVPALAGPFLPAPEPSGTAVPCEPAAAPVRSLESTGFYADPAFSRPDPVRLRADADAARPLLDWLALVQRAVARHRAGEAGAAACALAALDGWAKNAALLGAFNLQGGYHRKWTLAGAALSFLAIREAPGLDPVAVGRTARWLGEVAEAVRPHYERNSAAFISDVRNNHAAWAGLAVAAAGVAAGNRAQLDWGVVRLRAQLGQVDERGVLPQEARRAAMALHYHLLALEAVAALERLAAANGLALAEPERAAYARLRDLCLAAAKDPSVMEAVAGTAQADSWIDPWAGPRGPLAGANGLEIAAVAMPDPASEEALAPFRPFASRRLGGAVTGWWKPPGPPIRPAEAGP